LNHDEGALQQLERFIHHVQEHFADEEALLAKVEYPDLERHRRIHAGLVKEATRLHQRTLAGTSTLGELVEFLGTHVVSRHLLVADRQFFPWFLQAQARAETHLPISLPVDLQ
jgi:hemerythrin-like metal-binding protein